MGHLDCITLRTSPETLTYVSIDVFGLRFLGAVWVSDVSQMTAYKPANLQNMYIATKNHGHYNLQHALTTERR